jgi:hypothetical protein
MRHDTNAYARRCEHPLFPLREQLVSAFGALLFGYIVGELVLDQLTDPMQWLAGTLITVLIYTALLFGYRLHRLRQYILAVKQPRR